MMMGTAMVVTVLVATMTTRTTTMMKMMPRRLQLPVRLF
jgi:hypothetical protein